MPRKLILALCTIAVLAAGGGGAYVLIKLHKPPPREARPVATRRVRVERLEPEDAQVIIRGYGTIRARDRVSLAPEVGGRLVEVSPNLEPGCLVAKDDVLLRIDLRPYELAVATARAQVESLEAEIDRLRKAREDDARRLEILRRSRDLAEREFHRVRDLYDNDRVGSQAAVEAAERAYLRERDAVLSLEKTLALYPVQIRENEAKRAGARAQLDRAGLDVDRTTLRSPVAARVDQTSVEEGRVVRAGEPVVELEDLTHLEVPVPLDARDLAWLPFDLDDGDGAFRGYGPVRVEWAQGESRAGWTGRLGRIERFDDRTRSVVLVIEIENEDPVIRDGLHPPPRPRMFCRVAFPGRTARGVFRVPRELVRQDDTVPLLEDGRLRFRRVQVLRWQDADALIDEGLRAGDRLVLTPIPLAVEGTELVAEGGAEGEADGEVPR